MTVIAEKVISIKIKVEGNTHGAIEEAMTTIEGRLDRWLPLNRILRLECPGVQLVKILERQIHID